MTTATINRPKTAYERSLDKVRELIETGRPLQVNWSSRYEFRVSSQSTPGRFYTVNFQNFNSLDGAGCTCKAACHPCCIHRAMAFYRVIDFLGTVKGQQWHEQLLRDEALRRGPVYCAECGLVEIAHNQTDLCGMCIEEIYIQEAYDRYAATR